MALRPYEPTDEDAYVQMVSDPEVMRFLPGSSTMTDADARAAFRRRLHSADPQRRHFALVEKGTGALVGWAGLMPFDAGPEHELYFGLRRASWGLGYAQEAGARLLRLAREELGLSRVLASVDPANERALRTLERLGMAHVATEPHHGRVLHVFALGADPAPRHAAAPAPSGFCAYCGAAMPGVANFCPSCGRPRAQPAPAPHVASARGGVSQGTAIAALILNLIVPGVGSLIAGHRHGWPQLGLLVGSFLVAFATLFHGVALSSLMALGAWIWALVTSIEILTTHR